MSIIGWTVMVLGIIFVGLGSKVLYQKYFVLTKETQRLQLKIYSKRTQRIEERTDYFFTLTNGIEVGVSSREYLRLEEGDSVYVKETVRKDYTGKTHYRKFSYLSDR